MAHRFVSRWFRFLPLCIAASAMALAQNRAVSLRLNLTDTAGPTEMYRFALGQGGLSEEPMWADRAAEIRDLHPRVIRLFIQEYFDLLPDHGRYHWETLDQSVDLIRKTGATPLMNIDFKPKALYPAVDLCAGEKERGTMETLLISPAGREEIVWGKFLTIWVFSAVTALLNLLSMALTTWQAGTIVPGASFSPWALFWGVALLLPLSAFFSAVCLAVGAYARSSKEGQYYLMPLFLVTMPLIFAARCGGTSSSHSAWTSAAVIESCPQPAQSVDIAPS